MKFDPAHIRRRGSGEYWFECAMISTCEPVFDDHDDNYAVEAILKSEGVIGKNDKTDTETCALVVNFNSRKAGERFVKRLNRYLDKVQK